MVAQQKIYLALRTSRNFRALGATQQGGRPIEQREEGFIESAHASKTRRESDFGHRQARLVNELLREKDAARLRNGNGRGAEMLAKQTPELTLAHAEALRQVIDAGFVQDAQLDQRQCARNRIGRTAPCAQIRRGLRPAS